MRITRFETAELNIELKKPFITALRRVEKISDIIIKVHTDKGFVGYGEACAVTAITGTTNEVLLKDLNEVLFPLLHNSLIDTKVIFEKIKASKVSSEAKACLDIALYDLLSKEAGKALYSFLGASGSILRTDLTISVSEASVMQKNTIDTVEAGFETLKIKLDDDVSKNIQRLILINEVLPEHVRLRLDPNQSLQFDNCLKMLDAVRTDNIECIEQPFAAKDIISMKALKDKKIVPVLADESVFTLEDARKLLEADAVDMLNIKLMKSGGIHEALKISDLAKAYGKSCMIGSMLEGPISLLAAVGLGLSQENITMADLDSPLYLKDHPLLAPFHLQKDCINLDEKIGLGIDGIIQSLDLFPS